MNPAPVTSRPIVGDSTSGVATSLPPPAPPAPLVRPLYAKPIVAPHIQDLPTKPPLPPGQQFATFKTHQYPVNTPPAVYYQPGPRQIIMSQDGSGFQRPPNPSASPQNMRPIAPSPMNRPGGPGPRPPAPGSPAPSQYPNMRPQMPSPQPGMQRPIMNQNMRPTTPQQVRAPNMMPQNARPPFSPQNSIAGSNPQIRPGPPPVRPPGVGPPMNQPGMISMQQNRPAPIPQQIINNRPPAMPFKSPVQGLNPGETYERESPEALSRMQSDLSIGKVDSPKSSYLSTDDDEDVVIGKITPLASSRSPDNQISPTIKTAPSVPFHRSDSQMSIPSRPPSGMGNYGKQPDAALKTSHSPAPAVQSNEIVYKEKHMISPEKPLNGIGAAERMKTPSPEQGKYVNIDQIKPSSRTPSTDNMNRPNKPMDLPSSPRPQVTAPQSQQQPPTAVSMASKPGKPPQATPTTPGTERVTFVLPEETNSVPNSEPLRKTPVPPNILKKPDAETRGRSPFKNHLSVERNYSPVDNKGDNDSGVDESTQEKERNGPTSPVSPVKSPSKIPSLRRPESITPHSRSRSTSKQRLTAKTPETPTEPLIKKIPMNKIQVGATPSPNLKVVRSKIGSLENATHKPGGGNVKIETKKIEIKAGSRIEAKNEHYVPKGGDKKIITTKLQWNAKPKIGSLENATHKPGGGDKRIEVLKTDFKERARPKVGSKDNLGYQPGGGDVKPGSTTIVEQNKRVIINQKLDIKAESKVGSLENVKHKPGGGDKKIFDDREYLKQIDHPIIPTPPSQSPVPEFDQNSYY
ncbi:uncharacterized protein LOC120425109 isoform X4 [Culex pipiens pallens]|uniref:uncharacterized protein LOC120425109 isoform X4 n=1 Tax=Culex pipiens pallens TaxID=42434 RepID=UPI0022AAAEE7|nr:uncharacterized protein LOC120425109 isoform X4 [Culex pipiens pallens]